MWHEDQREFEVENIAPDHPIMRSFPQNWLNPTDELYVVEKVWKDITPFAHTYGQETKKYHSVTWTHEIDDARIIATVEERTNGMFEIVVFFDTVANSIFLDNR